MDIVPEREVSRESENLGSRLQLLVEKQKEQIEKIGERLEKVEKFLSNVLERAMPKLDELLSRHLQPVSPSPEPHTETGAGMSTLDPAVSLHEVAERGDTQSLIRMLAVGGEKLHVNARDASGHTALHVAVRRGHVAAVEALVEGGALVAARGPLMRRPLHLAAAEGHVHLVRRLMELGAPVDQRDAKGDTPLSLAAARGHVVVVKVLLPSASPDIFERCLLVAGNADVVWVLLDDDDLPVTNSLCVRAIGEAASGGRLSALEALVQAGFTPVGSAALHLAAEGGHSSCLKLLLREGCDPNININGETALHLASRSGHENCVRLLLDAGANVEATDSKGYTALHSAVSGVAKHCAQLLIEAGANVNAKDNIGWTPLHHGAYRGATRCVRLLIDSGAQVNASSRSGTPLRVASEKEHGTTIRLLLEKGARKK